MDEGQIDAAITEKTRYCPKEFCDHLKASYNSINGQIQRTVKVAFAGETVLDLGIVSASDVMER